MPIANIKDDNKNSKNGKNVKNDRSKDTKIETGTGGVKDYGPQESVCYLTSKNSRFEKTKVGFLKLNFNGIEYPNIKLYKSFPFSHSNKYVFVKDKDGKEIGCINDLNSFPQEVIDILEVELKRRYFIPKILEIIELKEKSGEYKWYVKTDAGEKKFSTSRRRGNLFLIGENRLLIKDVSENRYEIPNIESIKNSKHRRMIEAVMY